jgi:outer membrane protein assembly factor BamD
MRIFALILKSVMKKSIHILILVLIFTSCSEYQKVLKNEDVASKYKLGTTLFENGKFSKANTLFEQIKPKYRGKPQAEKLMYMLCITVYELKDYYKANYQMEEFVDSYPKSEKAEEIALLAAKSYYMLSPLYSKDQVDTYQALEKLQNFINTYPNSKYIEEANRMVKELDYKIEKKAYDIALQYNETGPFHRDYNSAIAAFDNFLLDFPGSIFKEDALFYRFDSAYKLASNSVLWKQEQRTEKALDFYESLLRAFPNTKYASSVEVMYEELKTIQNNLSKTKS